jgi:hypothetical protein
MRLVIPNCSECLDSGVLQVDPILRPKMFVLCDCQMEEFQDELDGKFGQGVFVSVEYGND